jgi:hypothetical protein
MWLEAGLFIELTISQIRWLSMLTLSSDDDRQRRPDLALSRAPTETNLAIKLIIISCKKVITYEISRWSFGVNGLNIGIGDFVACCFPALPWNPRGDVLS